MSDLNPEVIAAIMQHCSVALTERYCQMIAEDEGIAEDEEPTNEKGGQQ
jgi:hypothetical protein